MCKLQTCTSQKDNDENEVAGAQIDDSDTDEEFA